MSGLTKFFYSTMKGVPQLKADWGSLNDVLRTIFTSDDINVNVASDFTITPNTIIISFDEPHGYLKHQIIKVNGANETEFNNEYRVKSKTSNTITIINKYNTTTVTGTVSVNTASLGWVEKFSGVNKSVYEPKDTTGNRFLLRVDDSCPVGYDTTWAKFARVTISDGMAGIDDFGDFCKAPRTNSYVDTNENGNGVSGVNGIYGWAKWYHGTGDFTGYNEFPTEKKVSIPNTVDLSWRIVGDDTCVYVYLSYNSKNTKLVYAFAPIINNNPSDVYNCFLSACDSLYTPSSNIVRYDTPFYGINTWDTSSVSGNFILGSYLGIDDGVTKRPKIIGLGVSLASGASGVKFPNPTDNSIILNDIYLSEEQGGIRGKLPVVKWIHHNWVTGDIILDKGNDIICILESEYTALNNSMALAYVLEGD